VLYFLEEARAKEAISRRNTGKSIRQV
jgi:hypothetical protein